MLPAEAVKLPTRKQAGMKSNWERPAMTAWQCHNMVGWWGLGKEKCVYMCVWDP